MTVPLIGAAATLCIAGWAHRPGRFARRVRWLLPLPPLVTALVSPVSRMTLGYVLVALIALFLVADGHPRRPSENATTSTPTSASGRTVGPKRQRPTM